MCAPGTFHPNQYLLLNESYENHAFCCLLTLTLNNRFISAFWKPLVLSICRGKNPTVVIELTLNICFSSNKFAVYTGLWDRDVWFLTSNIFSGEG